MGEYMRFLALDPGVTTGFAIAVPEGDSRLYVAYGEATLEVEELMDLLLDVHPTHVICEDFEFRQRQRDKLILYSVQLIGIVRYYMRTRAPNRNPPQDALYLQSASLGKGYWSDEMLKQHGLYLTGLKHGRDACRHLMHWYSFGPGFKYNSDPQLHLVEMKWLAESYMQIYGSGHKWLTT